MTRLSFVWHRSLVALGLAAACVLGPPTAVAQVTSGTVAGKVTSSQGGAVIASARIRAVNQATGFVFNAESDARGRFSFPTLQVGVYTIQARAVGFGPVERRGVRVQLGETVTSDFRLTPSAVQLEEVTVLADAAPLVDKSQSGVVDFIGADAVQNIPTNGRNFADLVALSPRVQLGVGDGSGGNLSLGGGRRGANLIQIDGAGSTGTFFGGEARGSDRVPFAFSIEAVQEFQVITNAFDVEFGNFSGGVINAVTKSGTNQFHGSLFGYLRNETLTGEDFFGKPATEFNSKQVGGTFSGPLVRDKVHFYVSVERQDRSEPIFGLPGAGSVPDPNTNVHPDSVARFINILRTVYGVDDAAGQFAQTQDEWAVFGRLDYQINDRHRLTLRHNYTKLDQGGDRVNPDETIGNGGIFQDTGNSSVLNLNSVLGDNTWNVFRAQLAFEPRPRSANSLLPETEVFNVSDFGNGTTRSLRGMEALNDPVLPNNLEETTVELSNTLNIRAGDHTVKLGASFTNFKFLNFFFFQQQGRFRFNSLADFENKNPFEFVRALPNPGPDGQFFTSDDVLPLAKYNTREFSLYAQDEIRATDRLTITGGIRADLTRTPDKAPLNQAYLASTGLRTDEAPNQTNFSPRIAFTYDLTPVGGRATVFRGGVGLFRGRFPSVLYSNSLLNTGGNSLSLRCTGSSVPTPDYQSYNNGESSKIPFACTGGGAPSPPVANVNSFDEDFALPQTWKSNLGLDHALTDHLHIAADVAYSTTTKNFYVEDRNLNPEQFRSSVENRPVFSPTTGIRGSTGRVNFGQNRRDSGFGDGLLHVSSAESRNIQLSLNLEQRSNGKYSWAAGYAYSNTKDNSSYSCCISGTALFETPTAGDPNRIGDRGDELNGTWGPADFERRHTIVLSGNWNAPYGFQISGIWRTTSGRPYTPLVDGDANGDGRSGNDRAFISNALTFEDPADAAVLSGIISRFDCLSSQINQIAKRNSCRNPWLTTLDLRLRKGINTTAGQRVELIADLFNVLNGIKSSWSRNVGVNSNEQELVRVEGFDAATRSYIYSVNSNFGNKTDLTRFRTDQFQAQIGVRYSF